MPGLVGGLIVALGVQSELPEVPIGSPYAKVRW